MHRLQRINLNRDLWASSSDDDHDNGEVVYIESQTSSGNVSSSATTTMTAHSIPPEHVSSIDDINTRLVLLPAYPSLEKASTTNLQDHLLLVNVPRRLLTDEQRHWYDQRDNFSSAFQVVDRCHPCSGSSFFLQHYRELFVDLTRRLHLNNAILDYNYQRLLHCFDLMMKERISYGIQKKPLTAPDILPFYEYPIALEFFLQIDQTLFFMKTCSFRDAFTQNSTNNHGVFSLEQPYARYGMAACGKTFCHFCFPPSDVPNRTRLYQPVVDFSASEEHRFVSGYRSILNCPVTCQTKNILYVLTCPCGQFDYIGYTSVSLGQRLAYHREHGNRIIHEFLFGPKNILRVDPKPKSDEILTKDDMLLYRHSARCPAAMQLFLDCNPHYWSFVPMLQQDAQQENRYYSLPASIPIDPTSSVSSSVHLRSDHDAGSCMTDLPPLPSNEYTFSSRQCVEQFQYFQNKRDYRWPNFNLDLYNAKIIAVLPEQCSKPLYLLVEALFITHAQTNLNTLGHLERNIPSRRTHQHNCTKVTVIADRGNWCCSLKCRQM